MRSPCPTSDASRRSSVQKPLRPIDLAVGTDADQGNQQVFYCRGCVGSICSGGVPGLGAAWSTVWNVTGDASAVHTETALPELQYDPLIFRIPTPRSHE